MRLPGNPERRKIPRLLLQVLVRLRKNNGVECVGLTRDVSAGGIYLYSDLELAAGEHVHCLLVFPALLTQTERPQFVACTGTVVRPETLPDGAPNHHGVALAVEAYDFSGRTPPQIFSAHSS